MQFFATVGRMEPVVETEVNDGKISQVQGVVVYLNVGSAPMSKSGYVMIGPIIANNEQAELLTLGKNVVVTISY